MHPMAWRAAVIAEEARPIKMFDRIHGKLMTSDLSDPFMATIEANIPAGANRRGEAEDRVRNDVALAESLRIDSTPSFFVLDSRKTYGPLSIDTALALLAH